MKKLMTVLLSACLSLSVSASPGDDIWDHIRILKNSIGQANVRVQVLENNSVSTQATLNAHKSAMNDQERKIQQLLQIIEKIKRNQINPHYIGEEYRGGVVFYIDKTGQHGLIASKMDVNAEGVQWRNGVSGNKITNARGDGIGAGETNTRLIISRQTIDNQKGVFAALQASNFQVLEDGVTPCKTPVDAEQICYGGWYLPSAVELQTIHKNLHLKNLSSFSPEYYWSSTEHNVSESWIVNFETGELISSNKSNTLGKVRPIAQF